MLFGKASSAAFVYVIHRKRGMEIRCCRSRVYADVLKQVRTCPSAD